MQEIPHDDFLRVERAHRKYVALELVVGLVAPFLRPDGVYILDIVRDDDIRAVLPMPRTSDALLHRDRYDARVVSRDHDRLPAPCIRLLLERPEILLQEIVAIQLRFDIGQVQIRLFLGLAQNNDEFLLFLSEYRPQRIRECADGRL